MIVFTVVGVVFCFIFFLFGGFILLPVVVIQLLFVSWFEWVIYKAYQWTKDGEDMTQRVTYNVNQRQLWA